MDKFNQFFDQPNNKKWFLIFATSFFVLTIFKKYMTGSKCISKNDASGKVAVITGGSQGIGKQVVKELCKRHCKVIIGARNQVYSKLLIQEIKKFNPQVQVQQYRLDLSSKISIEQFSKNAINSVQKIDFLINNAGVMALPQRKETSEGFEMQMGTNHFGHFYLTYLLWNHLKKSDQPRIINVSSRAHRRCQSINFDDIDDQNKYIPWVSYGKSKLANIYFAKQLQRRCNQANIHAISVSLHPGVVDTGLVNNILDKPYKRFLYTVVYILMFPLIFLVMKNPWEGAQTTLHTVLEDSKYLKGGEYYSDCKVTEVYPAGKDNQAAKKLWEISQKKLGIKFDL